LLFFFYPRREKTSGITAKTGEYLWCGGVNFGNKIYSIVGTNELSLRDHRIFSGESYAKVADALFGKGILNF
jgi:hypothetical protein